MTKLYGIPNCASVKKARMWLQNAAIEAEFVNFKTTPPTLEIIQQWLAHIPLTTLLNRNGTTWRRLTLEEQTRAGSIEGAVEVMLKHPSVIKRPIVVLDDGTAFAGFNESLYKQQFKVEE